LRKRFIIRSFAVINKHYRGFHNVKRFLYATIRMEAYYALEMDKPIIPLQVHEQKKPTGWVGKQKDIANKLWQKIWQ